MSALSASYFDFNQEEKNICTHWDHPLVRQLSEMKDRWLEKMGNGRPLIEVDGRYYGPINRNIIHNFDFLEQEHSQFNHEVIEFLRDYSELDYRSIDASTSARQKLDQQSDMLISAGRSLATKKSRLLAQIDQFIAAIDQLWLEIISLEGG